MPASTFGSTRFVSSPCNRCRTGLAGRHDLEQRHQRRRRKLNSAARDLGLLEMIADDRALFAQGAVRAALWARDQKPGLYNMADVLGFND